MTVVALLLCLCAGDIDAFEDPVDAYEVTAIPDWVESVDNYQSSRKKEAYDGVDLRYRLYNTQVNAAVDRTEYFYEFVFDLTNRAAVESNAQLEIEFDPSYERLQLHRVAVLRDGVELDKLQSSAFQLMQRERGLEQLIYDGTQTLAVILDDVRVGDTVSYAYTRVGDNPIFAGKREFGFDANYGIPIDRLYMRVVADKSRPLDVRKFNTDAEVVVTTSGGINEYEVDLKEVSEFIEEDSVPAWRKRYGKIVFSEVADWRQVVEWAKPMYALDDKALDDVQQLAASIQAEHEGAEAQVGAALDWVQDEVRYFGVEMGVNSHQPSPPELTMRRRFGDCKDKSLLLIALLDQLGLDAAPALVNSRRGLENPQYPWRMHAFNHVIVYLPFNGNSYWLDPTDGYQNGKLGDFSEPNFGRALILDDDSSGLTEMSASGAVREKVINKQLSISKNDSPVVRLTVNTEHRKAAAESMRYQLEDAGVKELSKTYLDYYADHFDDISGAQSLEVQEHGGNAVSTQEAYDIAEFWMSEGEFEKYQWLYADEIQEYLELPEQKSRTTALKVNHPIRLKETWVIKAPHRLRIDELDGTEVNPFFSLIKSHEYDEQDHSLKVSFKFETKAEEIAPKDYKSYREAIERADDMAAFYIEDLGANYRGDEEYDDMSFFDSYKKELQNELSTYDLINLSVMLIGGFLIGLVLLVRFLLQRREAG